MIRPFQRSLIVHSFAIFLLKVYSPCYHFQPRKILHETNSSNSAGKLLIERRFKYSLNFANNLTVERKLFKPLMFFTLLAFAFSILAVGFVSTFKTL